MKQKSKKIAVGIVGGVVVIVGIILIPYPGPGWLVVFSGLAILSTEFESAQKVLNYVKGKYEQWQKWLQKQNPGIQLLLGLLTLAVTLVTLWLFNAYGIIDSFLHLNQPWLHSPLPFFK